jgi:hypothetical protein
MVLNQSSGKQGGHWERVQRKPAELLDILYQHPDMNVERLLGSDEFSYAKSEAVSDDPVDEEYADFIL